MSGALAGKTIPRIGLGCMGMSEFYGRCSEAAARLALRAAYDAGYRHFDTADMYGYGHNEELLGGFVASFKSRREELVLASKAGILRDATEKYTLGLNGRPEYLVAACERSLQRLRTEYLDVYYLHRKDPNVPISESIGALARLLEAGKIRSIGLSEVSAEVLRQACAAHPVHVVQSELSLWSRDAELVVAACADVGAAFVAFSPLGRGFLTGALTEKQIRAFDAGTDLRALLPRFQPANLEANLVLLRRFLAVCTDLGRAPAQVALAWVLSRGAHVHALAGSASAKHLHENFAARELTLPDSTRAALNGLFAAGAVHGARYPAQLPSAASRD